MSESLSRIHVHELPLSDEKVPSAANDNFESASVHVAANDNEIGPIAVNVSKEDSGTQELLSATRTRLGLEETAPVMGKEQVVEEEAETPNEVPQPEQLEITAPAPETNMGHGSIESTSAETAVAQAAGGASKDKGGGDGGASGVEGGSGGSERKGSASAGGKAWGMIKGFGNVLKYAGLWLVGALFVYPLKALIKSVNKIFDFAKLTKGEGGGGGGSKSSGGGGGSKPSGGGGGHH